MDIMARWREELGLQEAMRCAIMPLADIARISGIAESLRMAAACERIDVLGRLPWSEMVGLREVAVGIRVPQLALPNPIVLEQANIAAHLADRVSLAPALQHFRLPTDLLAQRLSALGEHVRLIDASNINAFAATGAFANLIAQSERIDAISRQAGAALMGVTLPLGSLAFHRQFLDAAGLVLPRWPIRLLTAAEKRRAFKRRVQANAEPPHVKRAKSLVHRYELTLREILDDVMAAEFGEDWPETRLPLCDCKDLLGKWRARGGDVLDHADYVHYANIMAHPEHFEAVFVRGFDDPDALASLMTRARKLRAASHHAHAFTPEDLRELRVTWRLISAGLLAFTPDFAFGDV